jgi:serine/threonine protein kinase
MSETPSELRGERIGRYEILGELGHGAMGVVYKARDPHLDRIVAIKALRVDPGLSRDQQAELERRFSQEAMAAGRLSHPNIVAVHDVVEVDGIPYIVMECVEGRTLADLITSGELRVSATLGLALQVCSALDYAHARGVVHRDIKPSNILVTEAGQVKVSDFGIARISGRKVTQTGALLGTPAYMSPEQVCGHDVDGRSDLFSLGLVLYEAITGRDAFRGDDPTAVLYQIVHEEPTPVRDLVPSVSPALDRAIRRALAKRPEERYATAGSFAEALRVTLERGDDRPTVVMQGATVHEARPRRTGRPAVLAAGAALVLVIVGGGVVRWAQWPARIAPAPEQRPAPPSPIASPAPSRTALPTTVPSGTAVQVAVPLETAPQTLAPSETAPFEVTSRPAKSSRDAAPADRREASSQVTGANHPVPPASMPSPKAAARDDSPRQPAGSSRTAPAALAPPPSVTPGVAAAPPRSPTPSVAAPPPTPPAYEAPTRPVREPASAPAGEARAVSPTPEEVKAQIVSLLRGSDKLAGVSVEVTPRLGVHLGGRVWDDEGLRLAVKLAGSVKGVTGVTEGIAVAKREMNEKFRQAVEGGTIRRTP